MRAIVIYTMREAAQVGDLFVTVTGCAGVITEPDFLVMKEGAILCNAGHFDVEIDIAGLRELAQECYEARHNIQGYLLPNGRSIYTLGEGRLVNLACGDGHPAEIMDMSFAIQALSALYVAEHRSELKPGVIEVPREIDLRVAEKKLRTLGLAHDELSAEQRAYLGI